MWLKLMPKGFTQKWSRCSGSRAVMWPATPFLEAELAEEPEPGREALLAVQALFLDGRELRQVRQRSSSAMVETASLGVGFQRTQGRKAARPSSSTTRPSSCTRRPVAPRTGDHRPSVGRPGDERRFGEHLGAPRVAGHDRDRREPARRRAPGPRIDEVVEGLAVALPGAAQPGAGRDRALARARASRCSRWRAGRRPRSPSRGVRARHRARGGRRRD